MSSHIMIRQHLQLLRQAAVVQTKRRCQRINTALLRHDHIPTVRTSGGPLYTLIGKMAIALGECFMCLDALIPNCSNPAS